MRTHGALARGVALMHGVHDWTEADYWDEETLTLAMKDGRTYRVVSQEQQGTADAITRRMEAGG